MQETHWQATAEFSSSGWYCVLSASPADDTLKAAKSKKGCGGQAHHKAEARPASSQEGSHSGPSVVRADGLMVLLSPRIAAKSVRWKAHVVGRVLEVRLDWQGARVTVIAVYQHVWSPAKTVHQNRQDRASLLKALGRCTRRVPHLDTLILAGDYSLLVTQPGLVGPAVTSPSEPRTSQSSATSWDSTDS